jgi:methylsterol monooxygenase
MEALNSTLTTISDNLLQTENLTWVERQWANIFEGRNEFITLTVFAFIYREVIYFGRFVPWWFCGKIKAFDKYKLQPVSLLDACFIQN